MKPNYSKGSALLVTVFIFLVNTVFSQNTFVKTYNIGEMGYCVREANGISYVAAGCTDYYYNFNWLIMSPIANTNIQLLKTTTDGTLLWEKTFTFPGNRSLATWFEHTLDNGYIITGRTNQDLIWPPDSNDIILIKTDNDGNIVWSKIFDTGKDELGYCVQQTTDGGYVISGFHDSMPLSLAGTTYAILIKTDASGTIQGDKKYELAVRDLDTGESFPWIVKQTADGGFILTGTTAGSHAADLYVIRTDQNGNLSWAKSYEHDVTNFRFSLGLDVIESTSGDFIIAGSLDKDQSLNEYNYPYILKLNSTGTILNSKFYESAPSEMFQSGFSSVEETPDGGYIFTGMGGYSNFGMLAQILKTDSDFNMEWSRTYSNDGLATVGTRSGRLTSDGCYIFTGKRFNDGTMLMKTDNLGLVPCKNPGSLIEMIPSILEVNKFPATLTGINEIPIAMLTQTMIADTSTLCPVTPAILPIELLSFNAKEINEKTVQLEWDTASEINNDYFEVEKSFDGIDFTAVGIIKGAGNSTINLKYVFEDINESGNPLNYYRLAQVDYDLTKTYSETISFYPSEYGLNLISSILDPEGNSIRIQLLSNLRKQIDISLSDLSGRTYYKNNLITGSGLQEINLKTGTLQHGIYLLSISDGSKTILKKVLF